MCLEQLVCTSIFNLNCAFEKAIFSFPRIAFSYIEYYKVGNPISDVLSNLYPSLIL